MRVQYFVLAGRARTKCGRVTRGVTPVFSPQLPICFGWGNEAFLSPQIILGIWRIGGLTEMIGRLRLVHRQQQSRKGKTMNVRIIGNESTGFRVVSGSKVVGFAANYSLCLMLASRNGWTVVR
jgi:hypothetical protein